MPEETPTPTDTPVVAPSPAEPRRVMSRGQRVLEKRIPGPFIVTGDDGKETTLDAIIIKHYPLTRQMRNEAVEEASHAYLEKFGKNGFLPTVFERALAERIIKSWNLPQHVTNGGWDAIEDPDLGDEISSLVGIEKAMLSLQRKSQEAEDAKNSSSGDSTTNE